MRRLLSAQDGLRTGMPELNESLKTATTEQMRDIIRGNRFPTEIELTIHLVTAMLWNVDAPELSRVTGLSLEAVKAIQEMVMKEVVTLQVIPGRVV